MRTFIYIYLRTVHSAGRSANVYDAVVQTVSTIKSQSLVSQFKYIKSSLWSVSGQQGFTSLLNCRKRDELPDKFVDSN